MEANSPLYLRFMKLWIRSVIVCFLVAALGGAFLAKYGSNDNISALATVAILFFPLLIVGFYGIRNRACAARRPGYVYRGFAAHAMNFLVICLYFVAVGAFRFFDLR